MNRKKLVLCLVVFMALVFCLPFAFAQDAGKLGVIKTRGPEGQSPCGTRPSRSLMLKSS